MAGTSPPRTHEEWVQWVNRQLSANRRAPVQLLSGVREQVDQIEQARTRTPTRPVEITWQTSLYTAFTVSGPLNVPYTAARLNVDFPDVTKATDGTTIVADRYELWGEDVSPTIFEQTTNAVPGQAVPGMTVPGLVSSEEKVAELEANRGTGLRLYASSSTSALRAEDFVPGRTYRFYVRAMMNGGLQAGQLSAPFTVLMDKDKTPPGQPTAPIVEASRGQLVVRWDGQAVNGAMPADFSYAVLAQGSESSPTQEVTKFGRGGGTFVATGLEYNKVQFFRLRAYDEAGNESAWSEQTFGYTTPLVDTDVILSVIDGAETILKNVDARVAILDNTIVAEHLVATEAMSAKIGQFLRLKAGQIDVNDLWADNAFLGYAEARLIRSDMFIGKAFEGGTFTLSRGGTFQTSVFANQGVKVTAAGIQAWNSSGTQTYDLSAATGDVVATGTFYTDLTGSRVRIGDREGISALDAWADNTTNHLALFEAIDEKIFDSTVPIHKSVFSHFTDEGGGISTEKSTLELAQNSSTLITHDYGYLYIRPFAATLAHKALGDLYTNKSEIFVIGGATPRAEIRLNTSARVALSNSDYYVGILGGTGPNYYLTSTGHNFNLGTSAGPERSEFMYMRSNGFRVQLAKGNEIDLQTGLWWIGPSVDIDGQGRGKITGGADNVALYANGTLGGDASWLWIRSTSPMQMTGGVNVFGNFSVFNGTKNFVMAHPDKIGRELVHAATESPWSGVEYWGEGNVGEDGFEVVELPDYFESLTTKDRRLLNVWNLDGEPVRSTRIIDGQFLVEAEPGTDYQWLVKAVRKGFEFDSEPWVGTFRNAGEPESDRAHDKLEEPATADEAIPVITAVPDRDAQVGKANGSKPASRNRDSGPATGLRDYSIRRAGGRSQ